MILRNTDNPSALDDAKQLTEAYSQLHMRDVYATWMRNLCLARQPKDAIDVLNDVSASETAQCLKELLYWLREILEDAASWMETDTVDPRWEQRYEMAAIALSPVASKLQCVGALTSEDRSYSESVCALWTEFRIVLAPRKFHELNERHIVMERYVSEAVANSDAATIDTLNPNDVRFMRLAEILLLEKATLVAILARTAAAAGKPFKAIALCNEILAQCPGDVAAGAALDVAEKMVRYLEEHVAEVTTAQGNLKEV